MSKDLVRDLPVQLFLGTFPPRQCGIATFTRDLLVAVDRSSDNFSEVIAVDDAGERTAYAYSGRVVHLLRQHDRSAYARTARFVNAHPASTLSVQHEFGIFGGPEGRWLFDLLDRVRKPVALTMHTVLPDPGAQHEATVRGLTARVATVVVLSHVARRLLVERYGVDPARVRVLPHGVPDVEFSPTAAHKDALGLGGRFVISTFGLIGRGKGLETAIDAVARVAAKVPNVLYLILGATHPVVARSEGESYRAELNARVRALGIERNVAMVDRYLNIADLLRYLAATDVYATPYVNPRQIVSGTLAYAVGCGKPVVSTPYLYASEMLGEDRGTLVPFEDAAAMADAFASLATDEERRLAMARRAYAFGRGMVWNEVGKRYALMLAELAGQPRRAGSLVGA